MVNQEIILTGRVAVYRMLMMHVNEVTVPGFANGSIILFHQTSSGSPLMPII